ncbi:hypothetical protein TSUD_379350 [Trifolium subterraneum]|uniref:Uncharacterized protein n=1 Tax=Trifolium subterraneum TaxID=3900 RepID=A0A2Z6PDN7_TRISU|nr:hypothetical protein TSUD_379350 [Trifolium subterraneum]
MREKAKLVRVNLAKFTKNSNPKSLEDGREWRQKEHNLIPGKSFRNAVVEEERMDVEIGGHTLAGMENPRNSAEIVWEVEVEEEVETKLGGAYVGYLIEDKDPHTIQNNFRMGGLSTFKVNAFGFMKVLLWSDKVGEVKEVVESVGWWCSLFSRVVPWSSNLVTNHRVTWLRCFGVPLHAWGNDLFRALAFKFGRFIEVDIKTRQMLRCDEARIKIVTGDKKVIDSSMAVKVKGQRFEIRVIEDTGACEDDGRRLDGVFRRGEEEISSKASSDGGGVSVVAAVEGFSESGSDADVSDSCKVLLAIQNHGEKSLGVVNSMARQIPVMEDVAGDTSHFLGNSVEVVGSRVNSVTDKGKIPMILESTGAGTTLENVFVGPPFDPVKNVQVVGPSHEDRFDDVEVGQVRTEGCVIGLDQEFSLGSACPIEKGVYKKVKGYDPVGSLGGGPEVLRTKTGDLFVFGSTHKGPSDPINLGENLGPGGVVSCSSSQDSIESFDDKVDHSVAEKKDLNKKNGRKKEGCRRSEDVTRRSDPITVPVEECVQQTPVADEFVGLDLEVVLPCQRNDGERNADLVPFVATTTDNYVEGGGFVSQCSTNSETQSTSIEVCEATKLIEIGRELGLNFKGEWHAEVYGKMEERKQALIGSILDLDSRSVSVGICEEEVAVRKQLFDDLWILLKSIDALTFQRSRTKWLKEGDLNTRVRLG